MNRWEASHLCPRELLALVRPGLEEVMQSPLEVGSRAMNISGDPRPNPLYMASHATEAVDNSSFISMTIQWE